MERESIEVCEVSVIHEDVLARVKAKMPDEAPVYEVSELFKVFGDSTRARIICALNMEEMCVCDLAALLGMTQSACGHGRSCSRLRGHDHGDGRDHRNSDHGAHHDYAHAHDDRNGRGHHVHVRGGSSGRAHDARGRAHGFVRQVFLSPLVTPPFLP